MAARLLALCAFLGVWGSDDRYLLPIVTAFLLLAAWLVALLRPPDPRVRVGGGWCPVCSSLSFHADGCPASLCRRGGGRR